VGQLTLLRTRFVDFDYVDGTGVFQSYSGNTAAKSPPRRQCRRVLPVRDGVAGRTRRFSATRRRPLQLPRQSRRLDAYTVADAYAFVDIPKNFFPAVEQDAAVVPRQNLTDRRYSAWGDPGYTDQIILGAPRSYEVAASVKW